MKDYQLFFDAVECEELFKFLHVDAPKDEVEYIIHNAPKEEVRTYCIFTCRARLLSRSVWITSLTICRVFFSSATCNSVFVVAGDYESKGSWNESGQTSEEEKEGEGRGIQLLCVLTAWSCARLSVEHCRRKSAITATIGSAYNSVYS